MPGIMRKKRLAGRIVGAMMPIFLLSAPLSGGLAAILVPAQGLARTQGAATVVTAWTVDKSEFHDLITAIGTAEARESVEITAQVTARVTEILFEDGQEVEAGTKLVQLERRELDAELKSLSARLEESRGSYNRAASLAKRKVVSAEALEERRSALRQVEAEIEAVKVLLDQREIRAPFSGLVGLREISPGALLQAGEVITRIDDLSAIRLDFDLAAVYLSALRPGLPVTARSAAWPGQSFEGQVTSISNRIDPVTRTVRVRARLDNPDRRLKSGMLLTLDLEANARSTLVVPEESVTLRGDKSYVYVVETAPPGEDGKPGGTKVGLREITPGKRRPGQVEILSGLQPGERIVWHGLVRLRDGQSVQVKDSEDGYSGIRADQDKPADAASPAKGS